MAAVVERLSALIGAGVAPARAWRYLAEIDPHPLVSEVVRRLDGGAAVPDAIASAQYHLTIGPPRGGASWEVVAAAWSVASEAGAPVAGCLDEIADTLRGLAQAERDTAAALASPLATTRLVLVLPVISVAGASLLGLDTARVLFGSAVGAACLVAGVALTALGALWSRRLVRRAAPSDPAPGLLLDLTAVAMGGGGSVGSAREVALATMARLCPTALSRAPAQRQVLAEILALAERSGAPPARLLRSEAVRLRRDAVARTRRRTAELGVWLMLPLGTCVLPAFLLLAVAPLLLSVLPTTLFPAAP